MPRIYYNREDYTTQIALFVLHCTLYSGGLVMLWSHGNPLAIIITALWTALLAYHSYWRAPLESGMQVRTYNRLRNRLGADWDLAATTEEFDFERQKAEMEIHLTRVLPDTRWIVLPVLAVWCLLTPATRLPLEFFLSIGGGWVWMVAVLNITLRRQLRETLRKAHAAQLHDALSASQAKTRLIAHSGIRYVVGDDGELVEMRQEQRNS